MSAESAATTPTASPGCGCPGSRRADARRNHDTLLEAASAVFAEHGVNGSLEEIARRAGVGIGTLYRHFPTREALVEAAYRRGVEQLCDVAGDLAASNPPDAALEAWMIRFVGYIATKKGLATVLKTTAESHTELFTYVHDRLRSTFAWLVADAADAGVIRGDVELGDLIRALGGICMVNDQPASLEQSRRLVALLMDGLRYGATAGA